MTRNVIDNYKYKPQLPFSANLNRLDHYLRRKSSNKQPYGSYHRNYNELTIIEYFILNIGKAFKKYQCCSLLAVFLGQICDCKDAHVHTKQKLGQGPIL
jgi:hypothetical protein